MLKLRSTLLLACAAFTMRADSINFSAVALTMPLSVANLELGTETLGVSGDALVPVVRTDLGADEAFRNWLASDGAATLIVEPNVVDLNPTVWSADNSLEENSATFAIVSVGLGALAFAWRRRPQGPPLVRPFANRRSLG